MRDNEEAGVSASTPVPLASLIRDEISRCGPISFERFMELALYHPSLGYYRRGADPFGRQGDFYTAEQLQPVFGRLMAAAIEDLHRELGSPEAFTVVELGAGRAEMAEAFSRFLYVPVDVDRGALPGRFTGVVFLHEFFDALPVHLAVASAGDYREMLVAADRDRFRFIEGPAVTADVKSYLDRYWGPREDGMLVEVNLRALDWMDRIAASLVRGCVLTIDYGFTARESVRFPRGTLMSYRRHQASEDVLASPGERDITAHVFFPALEDRGQACGLETVRYEPLARFLLGAGERDQFAAALEASDDAGRLRLRLQLKTLLFGLGETFRVLVQRKREETEGGGGGASAK